MSRLVDGAKPAADCATVDTYASGIEAKSLISHCGTMLFTRHAHARAAVAEQLAVLLPPFPAGPTGDGCPS